MAGPPAPPPPPPPPAGGMAAAQPTSQALPKITPDRNVLLSSIRKGTRLKKAVTNDRSGPITGGGGVISSNVASRNNASSHPSAPKVPTIAPQATHNSSASSQVAPADNSVGSQLAGILAGGMPKLKHISQTANASSKVYSAPKVPFLRPQKKLHNASSIANAGVSKFSVPSVPSVPAPPINRPSMPSHVPSHGNNAMPIPGMPTHRPPTIRKAFNSEETAGETASRNSNKPAFRNSSEPTYRNSKRSSSTSFNAPPIPGNAPPIPSNAPPVPSNAPPIPGNAPPIPGSAPSLPKQPSVVSGQKTATNAPPLPRNTPPVPHASPAIPSAKMPMVRQKQQAGASHKTEKVSSIPLAPPAPPAPPLPATLAPHTSSTAPHAPSAPPAPPLPSSAAPHTPSAPPLPASSAPPAPHLSSSKNTPLRSSNKHVTKPVQLPASSAPGALPFLADINKLRDESHVVGSEDVAKISAKRSSAPDAVPGTASNRAPNPRASNAQRTPNAQSTASSTHPKEPANPFLAAIMNRQEQISHKASKPAGVSTPTIPHVPIPSDPPPLPHTSSRRSIEKRASERLDNNAAERNTAIAPALPSAISSSSTLPSSSHLPPPSAPPPAFPESAPSIPTAAPSAPPPPAPINRSRASSMANQRSRSSSSTAASMRSKKAPPPPPPGVAPSISSTQLYAETPEDRLEQHPKHKVFGFGVKHTFKTDDSRINSQQNVGSDLRKIDVSAYTISGSGGTGSAGHVSGEKIQIDDSRFAFNGKNNLPKPRRFSGKVKLYPSGRGSSVPLDLALFQ